MKESHSGNEFTTVLQGKLQTTAGWGLWLLFLEGRQVLLQCGPPASPCPRQKPWSRSRVDQEQMRGVDLCLHYDTHVCSEAGKGPWLEQQVGLVVLWRWITLKVRELEWKSVLQTRIKAPWGIICWAPTRALGGLCPSCPSHSTALHFPSIHAWGRREERWT